MRLLGLHHVRMRARDLPATEAFASDFGLLTVLRDDRTLIMRTGGGDAYCLIVEKGDVPGFVGYAIRAEGDADLHEAVAAHGATPVRALEITGGGKAVTLTDPNGFQVDIVTGIPSNTTTARDGALVHNLPDHWVRTGASQNTRPLAPPHTYRLGHIGLFVKSFSETAAWCERVLGMIGSDIYHVPGAPQARIVGFYRLNRGEEWVDHHMLALMQREQPDLHHISFEVQDFEAQFAAHRYLQERGRELIWGVGRHPHGSHVFDVWRDPNGYRFETFSDTDVLNAARPPQIHDISTIKLDIWSSDPPDRYFA